MTTADPGFCDACGWAIQGCVCLDEYDEPDDECDHGIPFDEDCEECDEIELEDFLSDRVGISR